MSKNHEKMFNRTFGGQTGTPDPKLKGKYGGNCNITRCQRPGAFAWSMNNHAFYCDDCARTLNRDPANHAHYKERYGVDRFVFRLDTVTPEERAKWEAKGGYIPGAKEMDNVTCNNCDWRGNDYDLAKVREAETGDIMDACPNCRTDAYLMDIK